MGEKPQEVWDEISRWQRETGHSLEAVYSSQSEEFDDLSEEKRQEGIELWERYQAVGGGFGSDAG